MPTPPNRNLNPCAVSNSSHEPKRLPRSDDRFIVRTRPATAAELPTVSPGRISPRAHRAIDIIEILNTTGITGDLAAAGFTITDTLTDHIDVTALAIFDAVNIQFPYIDASRLDKPEYAPLRVLLSSIAQPTNTRVIKTTVITIPASNATTGPKSLYGGHMLRLEKIAHTQSDNHRRDTKKTARSEIAKQEFRRFANTTVKPLIYLHTFNQQFLDPPYSGSSSFNYGLGLPAADITQKTYAEITPQIPPDDLSKILIAKPYSQHTLPAELQRFRILLRIKSYVINGIPDPTENEPAPQGINSIVRPPRNTTAEIFVVDTLSGCNAEEWMDPGNDGIKYHVQSIPVYPCIASTTKIRKELAKAEKISKQLNERFNEWRNKETR